MGAYGKPLRILVFLASMLSTHPAKTGMFPVPLLFKRQETHNMVDLRPGIALISCNTAARLFSTCTKCEESRANGIGRPPSWIPLLLSRFDNFAIKNSPIALLMKTLGLEQCLMPSRSQSAIRYVFLQLRQLNFRCQDLPLVDQSSILCAFA